MKPISHLKLHQSVRARLLDRQVDSELLRYIVETTLDELGLAVVDGQVVAPSRRLRRRK